MRQATNLRNEWNMAIISGVLCAFLRVLLYTYTQKHGWSNRKAVNRGEPEIVRRRSVQSHFIIFVADEVFRLAETVWFSGLRGCGWFDCICVGEFHKSIISLYILKFKFVFSNSCLELEFKYKPDVRMPHDLSPRKLFDRVIGFWIATKSIIDCCFYECFFFWGMMLSTWIATFQMTQIGPKMDKRWKYCKIWFIDIWI